MEIKKEQLIVKTIKINSKLLNWYIIISQNQDIRF